jgi:hypothetical protein
MGAMKTVKPNNFRMFSLRGNRAPQTIFDPKSYPEIFWLPLFFAG